MKKNKKNNKFIRNQRGGLSIETIVVSSIILTVGSVGIYYVNDKLNDSKEQLADNQEENYADKDLVVNVEENYEPEDIPDTGDDLLEELPEKDVLATLEFHLPLNKDQNRETVITLDGLKKIENITVNNGGTIEVVKIEGDNVTIRVTGGDVIDRVIVSGQYIAAVDKYVTKQPTATYSDADGYVGTLVRYLDSYSAPYEKNIELSRVSLTNSFPSTISYTEDGVTINLTKNGSVIIDTIKGSASKTMYVTNQESANYKQVINDNGVETAYTGTLSRYVHSGEASKSQSATTNVTNLTNVFDATIPYTNGDYTGTLSKSGSSVKSVYQGSASASKSVTAQPGPNYVEDIMDNGIPTQYKGTLTSYVAKGSNTATKKVSNSIYKIENDFPETNPYSETITDNGITIQYTGELTKDGQPTQVVVYGSEQKSKDVAIQDNPEYEEKINDNGIETAYTGTLTRYVYQGSDTANKNVSVNVVNLTNIFDDTIPYSENITDNGISTKYTGTLSKSGQPSLKVIKGSESKTKYVTAQTSKDYVENITDNGISTAYKGTLTQYVYQGSDKATKTGETTRTNTTGVFDANITYSESYSDNGISTSYSGSIPKDGQPSSKVTKGSELKTKNVTKSVTNSTGVFDGSIYYEEAVSDNGLTAYYTGSLTKNGAVRTSVVKGSAYATQTATASRESTSNYFDSTYYYTGPNFNDNGVTTYYSGSLSKNGSARQEVTRGSAQSNLSSVSQTKTDSVKSNLPSSIPYSTTVSDNGVTATATATLTGGTISERVVSGSVGGKIEYPTIDSGWGKGDFTYGKNCTGGTLQERTITQSRFWQGWSPGQQRRETTSDGYTGLLTYAEKNGTHYDPYGKELVNCGYKATSATVRFLIYYGWKGTLEKPDTRVYQYSRTYTGTPVKPDTRQYKYIQSYSGTVSKPDTRVYSYTQDYSGTVTKPDNRQYQYTQKYKGTITKPDTRVYRYQGNVTKPDTRVYEYTQTYTGSVKKPDTRVYKYKGTVTKPDTRVYGYRQNYSGNATKPDTREYLYQGTVTKPDTRVYQYTQNYKGTIYTPDTRVYRYQGNVTKPDTRVYEYTQNYKGLLKVPERAIYMYQGTVTKPAVDTRVFQNLYEYKVIAKYYKTIKE